MIFLYGHGVSTNLAIKIYKTYGEKSIATIQKNPFQLERDIYGVGFKPPTESPSRLAWHPSTLRASRPGSFSF